VKYCFSAFLVGSMALAQSTTNTYMTDLNGNRVVATSLSSTDGTKTERSHSINGKQVALEQITERVVREDANGKVTEKIIRKYDSNGGVASTDRVVTEEQIRPGGGSTVHSTTFRSDINGQMKEAERKTIESRAQGSTKQVDTVIARPSINGSFDTVEKRATVAETSGATTHETETVYRPTMTGEFYEAIRNVNDTKKAGDQVISSTAHYEPGATGKLELHNQSASTTTVRPDGSEVTEVNLYARGAKGMAPDDDSRQSIQEQQIIQRRKGPDGSVIESLSVRRPSISDPTKLGELKPISETVCKGKCTP
jgi:hypothetical protein